VTARGKKKRRLLGRRRRADHLRGRPAVRNAYFRGDGNVIRSVPLRDQNITFA